MAASNFERAFPLTLKHEGGYVDNPKDPGGATNLGITIGTLSDWLGHKATKADVRALTPEKAKPIYKRNYWDKIGADRMEPGFDYACYDLAVNSGIGRAITMSKNVTGASPEARIKALCAARLAFLKRLPTWPTFGRGWEGRVNAVQRDALKMATATPLATVPVPPPPDIHPIDKPAPAPTSGLWAAILSLFKRKA